MGPVAAHISTINKAKEKTAGLPVQSATLFANRVKNPGPFVLIRSRFGIMSLQLRGLDVCQKKPRTKRGVTRSPRKTISGSGSAVRLGHPAVHPDRASGSAAGRASGLAARPAVRLGRPADSAGRLGFADRLGSVG